MEFTGEVVGITALIGALMPFVVSLLKRQTWSSGVKQLVALATSLVAAGIAHFTVNDFELDLDYLVAQAAVVFTASQVFYQQWFKDHIDPKLSQFGVK